MPSNHPACSPSVFGHTNNADKSPFGTTSPFGSQTGGSNSSSTGLFVGSPAFGTSSPSPFGGSSAFGQNPASECPGFTTPPSPFGNPSQESLPTMGVFGAPPLEAASKPAFGVSSIPASASSVTPAFGVSSTPAASGSNSTPAFGSTGSAFSVSNCPFGSTTSAGSSFSFASAPAFDHSPTPFGVTSIPVSPFGARATTPAFGDHACSLCNQLLGSRAYSYAQTPEEVDWPSLRPSNFDSISAMPTYKRKTHEELRWEDYQSGDKGGPNPGGQSSVEMEFKTNNMRSNLFSTPFGPATSPFSSNPFAQRPQTTFGTPGFVSSSHTHNSSPFAPPTSAPAQSQTPSLSSYPFETPTSPSPFCTQGTSNPFGPAQAQTPPVVYTTPSNPVGPPNSHSLFGTPNTSGFGTPPSVPTFGVSVTVAFGAPTTPVFGAPAFSTSVTPAIGTLPTPANGATSFSFSFSFPVSGQSASALGSSPSPFGAQSSPSGAHATAPNYGSSSSGQPYQQHMESILPPYAQTTEIFSNNGTQPAEKLESISATRTYEEKCHEELKWKDYQSGDKGGQTSNPSGSAQSQKPSLFRPTNIFGPSTPSPFGAPNTSYSGTSTSIFGASQAQGTNSLFGNTQSSSLFQSNSPAIGQMNSPCGYTGPDFGQSTTPTCGLMGPAFGMSPSFGFSTPIGTKNTSSSGTSTPCFGSRTLPSPSDTPNTPTSVSGSTPGLEAIVSPSTVSPSPVGITPSFGATTLPSPVGSELSIGTQSANLFQSSSPDLGQTSSPLVQTDIAFEQSTSAVSQANASEGTFSSTPLGTSSTGFNQTTVSSFS